MSERVDHENDDAYDSTDERTDHFRRDQTEGSPEQKNAEDDVQLRLEVAGDHNGQEIGAQAQLSNGDYDLEDCALEQNGRIVNEHIGDQESHHCEGETFQTGLHGVAVSDAGGSIGGYAHGRRDLR